MADDSTTDTQSLTSDGSDRLRESIRKLTQTPADLLEQLRSQSKASLKAIESLRELAGQSSLSYEELARALAPTDATKVEIAGAGMPRLASKIEEVVAATAAKTLERFRERLEALPPRVQEALVTIADRGWYLFLDDETPVDAPLRVAEALAGGDVDLVEEALCDYFGERVDEIEGSVIERFPARRRFIKAAFDAHRRNEYALSIPVLLAQADGICNEVARGHLFLRRGRNELALYVAEANLDAVQTILLEPLKRNLSISQSQHERGEEFSGLNRHEVLHGDSLDYDSRKNGLRAVSLIDYVARVLNRNQVDGEEE